MADDWDDIQDEPLEGDDSIEEEGEGDGKFEKLLGEDSKRYKLSGMFKDWFLDYSSYVILHRAVPNIVDGLKPVQRRVLHAMYRMDDGAYTKVANIVGQAMQFHPHGDASILGALVQIGQKGYMVDCQGNWGNIFTGDANAAPRYIEARLSKFAKEVVFDPKITEWMKSYDGRSDEPIELPVRFPILLAHGTEGIAVGMASRILPHNFNELIDASVAYLKGRSYELYPDFPTGGYADCSKYMCGKRGGIVKVRAKIEKVDKNTIVIREIPYGKTTGVLIESILKAKDKGKIKIKKVEDLTTDKVEIVIHLPNDVSPDKTIDALYAFTDCECTIAPNACVIVDDKPQFLSVNDILEYSANHTRELLGKQLEIKLGELANDWHYNSLEKIFFENRVYKILEQDQKTWEDQLSDVFAKMKEFQGEVRREIVMEDILKLVEKPVRKISKFDAKAVEEKIRSIEEQMALIQSELDNLTDYTIEWFKNLKKKYGAAFPRKTEITSLESITATKVINNNAKLSANMAAGFVGIGLKNSDGGQFIDECSELSEVLVIARSGKWKVTKVSDKAFFWEDLVYVGVFNRGDDRTIYNVIYRDGKTSVYYAKRFAITSVSRDKEYDVTTGKPGSEISYITANHNGEAETVRVYLRRKPKLKKTTFDYDFSTLAIKGKGSRGNLVTKNAVLRVELKSQGVSTISGKDIYYDADVQRLNEDGRGIHLGEFSGDDKILCVFKNGTFYTTSYDLSNRYQGDVLLIEKYSPTKTFTALYYDGAAKSFYVKRFSFPICDNTPTSFISDGKGSYLVEISSHAHPRFRVIFGKKYAQREPEEFEADEFIAKKGIAAKGKKCHSYDLKKVLFVEPTKEDEPEDVPDIEDEDVDIEMDDVQETSPVADPEVESGSNEETSMESAPAESESPDQGPSPAPSSDSEAPAAKEEKIEENDNDEPVDLFLGAEIPENIPPKPRKKAPSKPKGPGAKPGDVIDLGADDIPDDEPTLFDGI